LKTGLIIFTTMLLSGCTSMAQSMMAGPEKEYQKNVDNVEATCKINLNYEAFAHRALEPKLLPIIKVGTSEKCLESIMMFKKHKINKTTSAHGVSKQYVVTTGYKYISQSAGSIPSEFMYIYSENGKVTGFQD
jgi:hypothetical protein